MEVSVKRSIKIVALALVLVLALFVLASIVHFVVLSAKWSSCKNDLAISFSGNSAFWVEYQGEKIAIRKDFEKTNIFREFMSAGATGFQDNPTSDDIMEFRFSNGSHITASRYGENQVQFYFTAASGETYGFTLSESASFKNLRTFVLRNAE